MSAAITRQRRPVRLDPGPGLGEAGGVARHGGDVGTGVGQHPADLQPDALGRTGHQRPFAREREPLDE